MAQKSAEITVQEYGRVEDVIHSYIDERATELPTREIARTADVTLPKVREALAHMALKHDCLVDAGAGEWRLELPEE